MVTKVAVLGPAGFGGSYVVNELLSRGSYHVTGISRNPDKIGKHDRYTPLVLDITNASIAELVQAFKSVDVVINAFNPPYGPSVYSTLITDCPHTFSDQGLTQNRDVRRNRPKSRHSSQTLPPPILPNHRRHRLPLPRGPRHLLRNRSRLPSLLARLPTRHSRKRSRDVPHGRAHRIRLAHVAGYA